MATKAELEAMLAEVESAIKTLAANPHSQTSIGSVSYTYTDISKLRAWRRDLQAEIGVRNGPMRSYARFDRPK